MWKAQIATVGDIAGYRSMTCWTSEQQLRQSAVHLRRIGDASVNRYLTQPAARTITTKTGEQNSVRIELNLKLNLRSTYCSIEANDRLEASRGLFATAELLVSYPFLAFDVPIRGGRSPSDYCLPIWCRKTRMMGVPDGE